MISSDRKVVIVFNGEIYNFRELRAQLEEKGYIFHGNSDTVVPYNGVVWSVPVEDVHTFWANNNNCQNQSEISVPDFNNDGIINVLDVVVLAFK